MYPRVSRSAMLIWTLDRYTFAKLNTHQRTYHLHPFAMYIHTCHCDHWHHASFFFAKLRTFSVDMLSRPNFHKCEHFAQELESVDSANRLLSELMPFLNKDACLIAQILKRTPWLEQQLNKFWGFNVAFPKHCKKHVLMKLGNHWSSLVWFSLTARLSSTCPWS